MPLAGLCLSASAEPSASVRRLSVSSLHGQKIALQA